MGEAGDLARLVTGHEGFTQWNRSGRAGDWGEVFDLSPTSAVKQADSKALFDTTGWAPFSPRTPDVIPAVTRPIQTQAKGGDPLFDAVRVAATKVQLTGRAAPNAIVMHPTDWETAELTRSTAGLYILLSPGGPGGNGQMWRLPVVVADVIAQGTALMGSFMRPWITLWERQGVDGQVGFVGDQFARGMKTIRADGRWALTVARLAAFCQLTGL